MDSTIFDDVTKSVNQLCHLLSLSNINVPSMSAYSDCYDFLVEFETATATLTDEQKVKLLVKSFPTGRYRAWFDTDLSPAIDKGESWLSIRNRIIKRFSDTEDRVRHFVRLRELKYVPEQTKLIDFIEDLNYSFVKAFPNVLDEEAKLRYIKAAIPSTIKPALSIIPDYHQAKNFEGLKQSIRQFDQSKIGSSFSSSSTEKVSTSELSGLLKQLIDSVKKEGEDTRKAVVASLQLSERSKSY